MSDAPPSSAGSPTARLAITLSLTEIALGGVVHGFKIPLGGHLLSLNEGAVLTWAARSTNGRREAARRCLTVAQAAALLKSLSPMGNRLGPMLAISTQGLLYAAGVLFLGRNRIGAALGMVLLSLWGFLQPVLIAGLLFGKPFFSGLLKLWTELAHLLGLSESLLWPILLGFVVIKALTGVIVVLSVWRSGPESEGEYLHRLETLAARVAPRTHKHNDPTSALKGALTDLFQPVFLAGAAVSLALFTFSGAQGAPDFLLYALRIFGTGLLVFWGLRALPTSWRQKLQRRFPEASQWAAEVERRLLRS
jgi:hypothetical protein